MGRNTVEVGEGGDMHTLVSLFFIFFGKVGGLSIGKGWFAVNFFSFWFKGGGALEGKSV